MTHFISANNAGDGYYTTSGRNQQSAFSQGIFANNGGQGFEGDSSTSITKWHNMAFIGNGSHGFWNNYSPAAHMYGQFIVGSNTGDKCAAGQSVTGRCTASGTDGSTDWTNQPDSNAYLRTNHNLLDSFYGEVTEDSYNQTATLVEEQTNITDWTSFENVFRMWGLAGATTNHLQVDQRGICTGAGIDCRVWDWRLVAGATDNILFNRSGNYTVGDQVNEVFVGDGITNCPSAVNGDITMVNSFSTPLTYLVNALEISDDEIGNDNTLCETGESCIYSPNIGPYQGEGNYQSNGTCNFVDGVGATPVSSITMYAFPTNGAL
jgi:hypothetical protein